MPGFYLGQKGNIRYIRGKYNMKKKLTTVLLAITLLINAMPVYIHAEECTEHKWEWYVIDEPDCNFNGLEGRRCENCYEEEYRPIPATGHKWEEWITIEEATCSMSGYKARKCTLCYATEREGIPATGEHNWGGWIIDDEPSCEYEGSKYRECTICYEEEEEKIPATNEHDWDEWETAKKATALSPGKKSRVCIVCYKKETKDTPKLEAKISLKEKSIAIESGKSHKVKIKSKTYGDKIAKWFSSNNKIAAVNQKGNVTGKKEGTATITLKMKSGIQASCKVKVTKPKQNNNSSQKTNNNSKPGNGNSSKSNNNDTVPPSSGYVWIPNTGNKYHKTSTCSGMKNPSKVTVQEAKNAGYEPCSKCY